MGIEVWVNKTLNSHRVSCACLAWTSQHDLCRMSRFSANKEVVYPVCGKLGMRTLVGLQETRVCVPTLTDGIGVFQQTRHHTTTPIAHAVAARSLLIGPKHWTRSLWLPCVDIVWQPVCWCSCRKKQNCIQIYFIFVFNDGCVHLSAALLYAVTSQWYRKSKDFVFFHAMYVTQLLCQPFIRALHTRVGQQLSTLQQIFSPQQSSHAAR